jgi:hypothetical protein
MNYQQRKIYTSQDTTPRQRRLAAQRRVLRAGLRQTLSAAGGILLLAAIIICLFFI